VHVSRRRIAANFYYERPITPERYSPQARGEQRDKDPADTELSRAVQGNVTAKNANPFLVDPVYLGPRPRSLLEPPLTGRRTEVGLPPRQDLEPSRSVMADHASRVRRSAAHETPI
jgi:hypothetical protein